MILTYSYCDRCERLIGIERDEKRYSKHRPVKDGKENWGWCPSSLQPIPIGEMREAIHAKIKALDTDKVQIDKKRAILLERLKALDAT